MPKSTQRYPALHSPEAIGEAVGELRDELHRLAASLAKSVLTQEIVVAGKDGLPRAILSASGDRGCLELLTRSPTLDVVSSVEVFATDASDSTRGHVGVALAEQGDVVGIFANSGEWRWVPSTGMWTQIDSYTAKSVAMNQT